MKAIRGWQTCKLSSSKHTWKWDVASQSQKQARALHRKVDHLKLRIITEVNRVCIDKDMDADMCTINMIPNVLSTHLNHLSTYFGSSSKIIYATERCTIDAMTSEWCMNLHMLSSSCYDALRSTRVLKLPSEHMLRDYTHTVKSNPDYKMWTNSWWKKRNWDTRSSEVRCPNFRWSWNKRFCVQQA